MSSTQVEEAVGKFTTGVSEYIDFHEYKLKPFKSIFPAIIPNIERNHSLLNKWLTNFLNFATEFSEESSYNSALFEIIQSGLSRARVEYFLDKIIRKSEAMIQKAEQLQGDCDELQDQLTDIVREIEQFRTTMVKEIENEDELHKAKTRSNMVNSILTVAGGAIATGAAGVFLPPLAPLVYTATVAGHFNNFATHVANVKGRSNSLKIQQYRGK